MEIQRLIGRALRGSVDLALLGPRTLTLDCDVLQADGGTRTAAVTGAYVALALAARKLRRDGVIVQDPVLAPVAAVSVGFLRGEPHLDLDYAEDSSAEVDMNVVANGRLELIEVQGTAEGKAFARTALDAMMSLALEGIGQLVRAQQQVLG
jgi:ribonuclease PH